MTRTAAQKAASRANLAKARAAKARRKSSWRGSPVKPNTGILSGSKSLGMPRGTYKQQMKTLTGKPGYRRRKNAGVKRVSGSLRTAGFNPHKIWRGG